MRAPELGSFTLNPRPPCAGLPRKTKTLSFTFRTSSPQGWSSRVRGSARPRRRIDSWSVESEPMSVRAGARAARVAAGAARARPGELAACSARHGRGERGELLLELRARAARALGTLGAVDQG